MTQTKRQAPTVTRSTIRCAVYTRKSTEEGLQQDFNTLDAQRESAEAYITAHKHEGWVCLPDRYDDGGYTGANLDRPAFTRLLKDVETCKVDAIVIYKIDRLSRSLMDFARVMEILERHNVALIAITQSLDTKTSMGRLTLNVLLSFAQFEREIISERTRDKIAAARRKGKWSGGKPLLGYDAFYAPGGTKLVVNEEEAARVRVIFETYLKQEALIPAVTEIAARGWTNKRWTTKAGTTCGGRRFDKATLYQLLTNITYLGKVRYKEEVHAGEHPAIIDPVVRDGQPVFSPPPRVFRTIKLNGANDCRPEAATHDFALKRELVDLLEQLDAAGDAVIPLIDVRHGLPLLMELEDASLV